MRRPRRWHVLAALVLLDAAARFTVALKPIDALDRAVLTDDAYLSLTIARNIAHGLGPLYGHNFTNGFQPLYVFLLIPFYKVFNPSPDGFVRIAECLLAAFDVAACAVLARMVARRSRSWSAPAVAIVGWMLSPMIFVATGNGLETVIALFFILASLALTPEGLPSSGRRVALGACLGAALLTRIDCGLFALALALTTGPTWMRIDRGRALTSALVIGVTAVAVNVPWWIYSWRYTGTIYPVSGRAVHLLAVVRTQGTPGWSNWAAPLLGRSLALVVLNAVGPLLAMVLAVVAMRGAPLRQRWTALREQHRPFVAITLFGAMILLAYSLYLGGWWYFFRYLAPCALAPIFWAVAAVEAAEQRLPPVPAMAAGVVATIAIAAPSLAQPVFWQTLTARADPEWGFRSAALWANRELPPGSVVGTLQSGALGYYGDALDVVNLDGVVNADAYLALKERRLLAYARDAAHVQFVMDWPVMIDVLKQQSSNRDAERLERVGELPIHFRKDRWQLYRVR